MTIKVNYGELDQGILHPKLEVPRLTCLSRPGIQPGPPRWEAITLAKSYSNSVIVLFGT
jgi:hypothetical protein